KLGRAVLKREMRCVFLKQFYDAADGTRACYQAIIEAPLRATGDPCVERLPGVFHIRWQDLESHRVGPDCGLPLSQTACSAVTRAFDYEIGNGRTIWQAR